MSETLDREAFAAAYDLPGWQVGDTSTEVTYELPSFTAAGRFVAEVAAAADRADHHPDVDLRYPGKVTIVLSSHDAGGLTERDGELAAEMVAMAATVDARVAN